LATHDIPSQNSNYLVGKLLLALPSMGDPRFHRAVIFICAHDEEGAMGLVINHEMPGVEFKELVGQLKLESDIKIDFEKLKLPVLCGGPVESARGFLLHSDDFSREDTMRVEGDAYGYGVSGTVDAIKDIAKGDGPDDLLFILGYAGWDAGQLDAEIAQNSWLVVEPDPELIFGGDAEDKWTRAVNKLGVDPAMLSSISGSA